MLSESGTGKLKKVRLYFPYPEWDLFRQTPYSNGIWGNYQFFLEDTEKEYDYWVIYTDSNLQKENCNCPPENIFFFTVEPPSIKYFGTNFLKQFPHVITCQENIKQKGVIQGQCGVPWFVGKNYDELINMPPFEKNKTISVITSNKVYTKDHEKRIEFALKLKTYFKDEIDLFGRGINPFDDKWNVLAPYKYSIAIENDNLNNLNTEKIHDCHLAYTFPLYYGCPNLSEILPDKSFQRINIYEVEKSLKIIETILNDTSHYHHHLPFLQEARILYLNHHQFFPLIGSYLDDYSTNGNAKVVTINKSHLVEKIYTKVKHTFDFKVYRKKLKQLSF